MKPTLTVNDFTKNFLDSIKILRGTQVLVGIPREDSSRNPDPKESNQPVNNAMLLYLAENGSPVNNVPARHPLSNGIKRAKDEVAEQFKKAAQTVLAKGHQAIETYYERAGIIAANSVKQVINEQFDMAAPAASTLKARKAKGFKGTKALIVTAQMRNAITSVLRRK